MDPKIARSLIRVYRKELKQRQEAIYIDAAKEVGLGSVAATIYSGGQIAKSAVEGIFNVMGKVAGQSDPINFAAEVITAGLVFTWFTQAYPGVAKLLRIDNLAFRLGIGRPKETVNGAFLLEIRNKFTGQLVWESYADEATRQAAIDWYGKLPQSLFAEVVTTQESAPPFNKPSETKTSTTVPAGAIGPFATIGAAAIAAATNGPYAGYTLVRVNGIIYIVPPGTVLT